MTIDESCGNRVNLAGRAGGLRAASGGILRPDLWKKPEELKLRVADVEGIIVRNQTKVGVGLLDVAPGMKVVSRLGIGPDNIDVAACKQLNF